MLDSIILLRGFLAANITLNTGLPSEWGQREHHLQYQLFGAEKWNKAYTAASLNA